MAASPRFAGMRWLPGRRGPKPVQVAASVVEVASAFADELRAGRMPREAWTRASEIDRTISPHGSLAAAHGADVAAALVRDAQRPGAEGLARIAACWTVGEQRGAGLSKAVGRVVTGLRDEATHRREVASAMAGPRATVLVLAGLPLMGLAMGSAVGVHPLDFLLRTPVGWGCLVVGLALEAIGIGWVQRMVAKAERDA
jgi:tight adherence protein B